MQYMANRVTNLASILGEHQPPALQTSDESIKYPFVTYVKVAREPHTELAVIRNALRVIPFYLYIFQETILKMAATSMYTIRRL